VHVLPPGQRAAWAVQELERRFPEPARRARRQRLARAQALWRDARPEAEEALLEVLLDPGESELMRANAATALGSVQRSPASRRAAEALAAALDDQSQVVAARAARSLGTRREKGAAEALAHAAAGPARTWRCPR